MKIICAFQIHVYKAFDTFLFKSFYMRSLPNLLFTAQLPETTVLSSPQFSSIYITFRLHLADLQLFLSCLRLL